MTCTPPGAQLAWDVVRCPSRYQLAILACALALALWPFAAHAQSDVDGFNPGANGDIKAFAVQADGKILVGGAFTMIGGGGTGSTPRNYLARLNIDGSVDPTFNPDPNGTVFALALQPNGQILVGGDFTTFAAGTISRSKIARLDADGTVDGAFDPGANNTVFTLAVQGDGQILVGCDFTQLGGGGTPVCQLATHLARVASDGTLDGTFDPGASAASGRSCYSRTGRSGRRLLHSARRWRHRQCAASVIRRLSVAGVVDRFRPEPQ